MKDDHEVFLDAHNLRHLLVFEILLHFHEVISTKCPTADD